MNRHRLFLLLSLLLLTVSCQERNCSPVAIASSFAGTPPREAYPWVWWHWMSGNISKEGIRKDLLWMHESGFAGLHHFDAGYSNIPQIVPERIPYMTDDWKDAFRYAISLTDSLGMEVGIASSPGWSSTGGPWVSRENGMKKLVWRTVTLPGGDREITLPEPFTAVGPFQDIPEVRDVEPWYEDIAVVAVRIPEKDRSLQELGAVVTSSEGNVSLEKLTDGSYEKYVTVPSSVDKGEGWIQYSFPAPASFKAVTVVNEKLRPMAAGLQKVGIEADFHLFLECSDDNVAFREVAQIPDGCIYTMTTDFPETTARYWRLRVPALGTRGQRIREFVLHPVTKVNHAPEKAGFDPHADFMEFPTPESPDAIRDVIVLGRPGEDGKIRCNLPEGTWRLYRFGQGLTGKKNHPATPESTGLEVDKLDPEAWLDHFHRYMDMYKEAAGGMVGQRGVQYILLDSYEARQMTWTRNMEKEFRSRNGYDVLRWLPALTGEIIDSSGETEKFLWDWRKTIGDLMAENYDRVNGIVKEYGMRGRYTESHENSRAFIGDGMDLKMTATVPMSAIWVRRPVQMRKTDIRESSSTAHIFGQNIAAAETFTVMGTFDNAYSYPPESLKYIADVAMESGLNRFVFHESAHQPSDDKVPGTGLGRFGQWFSRHETWAGMIRPWMDYLARSCYLLQQGRFVADILFYYGEDNTLTGLYGVDIQPVPEGYNFDYINPKGLLKAVRPKKGKLVTKSGMSYEILFLGSNCKRMSLPILRRIIDLAEKGVPVCGTLPEEPAGMNDDNETFVQLRSRLQGLMKGENMADALAGKGIAPDFTASDDSLGYVHRRLRDRDIYWVRNFSEDPVKADIRLRTPGGRILEVWNPENGKQYSTEFRSDGKGVATTLEIDRESALFLVVKYGGTAAPRKPEAPRHSLEVPGPWKVCFQPDRGAPESVVWETLRDWSQSEDEGIRYFSGTADYTTCVHLDMALSGPVFLSLGTVNNLARVSVNGTECGIAWKRPFAVEIPDGLLKAGDNTLTISVANLWVNRIIGDRQPGCGKTYTSTPMEFYSADSPLLPSGLLGPVTFRYQTINE
ncbi:MAG: hypothetical protein IJL56_06395 [Bacteroidales bacterium]|nr:hypothetical protein [Bacteroidales bacterium]